MFSMQLLTSATLTLPDCKICRNGIALSYNREDAASSSRSLRTSSLARAGCGLMPQAAGTARTCAPS